MSDLWFWIEHVRSMSAQMNWIRTHKTYQLESLKPRIITVKDYPKAFEPRLFYTFARESRSTRM
jgi:hypothetical protein